MFWNGSEPGTQGKLKAVSIQDPVEDRPAGHTGPAAADGPVPRAWEASGGGSGALSPSVSINVEKTPSRSMGRWRSRPLTGAMGKPEQASRVHPTGWPGSYRGPWDGRCLRSQ